MVASDVGGRPPAGQFLRSDNFYWVVAACSQGRFHFNAFQAGDPRFDALTFPKELFDAELRDVVFALLRDRASQGCNVILVTHDRELADRCDDVFELNQTAMA